MKSSKYPGKLKFILNSLISVTFLLILHLSLPQLLFGQAVKCFDGPYPPCREYWRSAAVFSGQVTNISLHNNSLAVRFKTGKFFLGDVQDEIEVFTNFSKDGGYDFQVGENYLVYAQRSEGKLVTKACSATKPLDKAYADIAYLNNLKTSWAKEDGEIFGQVKYLNRDFQKGRATSDPKANVRVRVEGENYQIEQITDAEGNFRVRVRHAGRYKIKVYTPTGFQPLETREYELRPGECGFLSFEMRRAEYIAGHVLSREGLPVSKGQVYIHSVDEAYKNGFSVYKAWFTEIDESGNYKFEDIPPGKYVIAINPYPGPPLKWHSPYPQTYFPGVPDLEHAGVVTLGEEQKMENIDLRMSSPIKQHSITGSVEYSDGRPGAGISINFYNEKKEFIDSVVADADGKFAMTIYEGFTYFIQTKPSPVESLLNQSQLIQITSTGEIKPVKLIIGEKK